MRESQREDKRALPTRSREAAKECSPRRKPWVGKQKRPSPEGAKERHSFPAAATVENQTTVDARGPMSENHSTLDNALTR
jgi:hypothetical protein